MGRGREIVSPALFCTPHHTAPGGYFLPPPRFLKQNPAWQSSQVSKEKKNVMIPPPLSCPDGFSLATHPLHQSCVFSLKLDLPTCSALYILNRTSREERWLCQNCKEGSQSSALHLSLPTWLLCQAAGRTRRRWESLISPLLPGLLQAQTSSCLLSVSGKKIRAPAGAAQLVMGCGGWEDSGHQGLSFLGRIASPC